MNMRTLAAALFMGGTLCCSWPSLDFGGFNFDSGSTPSGGCSSPTTGCPALGPQPPHANADAAAGVHACPAYGCDVGWASCDGICSTNVLDDANNCGACGNTCASGTCSQGSCLPIEVVASGFASPRGIALDAASVYFGAVAASASGVFTAPKNGGAITNDVSQAAPPPSIAVDVTGTYFTVPPDDDRVDSPILVTRQPGDPITRLGGYAGSGSIVLLDAGAIYWNGEVVGADGATEIGIFSIPETGGDPTLVVPVSFDYFTMPTSILEKGIAFAGGDLFYVDGRNVMVLRAGAAAPTLLYTDPSSLVIDLTTDDTFVYWYGFFSDSVCASCDASTPPTVSAVRRMPLAGGAVDVLFNPSDGTEIFVAGGSVYTVDADVVSRADPSTRVYSVIAGGQGDVAGFASDDGFVYWTVPGDGTADPTTGGKVLRTPL